MFDPLDLYTADEIKTDSQWMKVGGKVSENERSPSEDVDNANAENLESGIPLDVIDLPQTYLASPQVILCILRLLQPAVQINFGDGNSDGDVSASMICREKGIPLGYLDEVVRYYTERWPNSALDNALKVCSEIPQMAATHGSSMLPYYTSVLKHYENKDHDLRDEIIKQASSRIAESCGRTAQPSMSRKFTFDHLARTIEIHEPSLTADNLGWKTWGSSFILSQKLINKLHDGCFKPPLRVLELGSGTGLAGVAWLTKWIELYGEIDIQIFLTDLPVIISNLRTNVDLNALGNVAKVAALDWTDPSDFTKKNSDQPFDIILVSDPIYSPNHPELVVNMIERFLSEQGTCFLEIPIRPRYAAERTRLRQLLKDHQLAIVGEEMDQGLEDWGMVEYLFLEIKRE